ncbi:hypothetical protein [Pseudomonas poae]|uniref:hypothetical protein n=1 Tax=Pseudomonas poae TaxID=200451 RepID=UPI000CFE19B3|nr:hypothetical protein [Pseudomonas poae]
MIGPVPSMPVYPAPTDTSNEDPTPARKKRSLDTHAIVEPENAATDRTRRRNGGGLDSLGRGNIL